MPRKNVPLITGETYHVFNRGTDKRDIFIDKSDYLRFYQSLYLFNTVDPVVNFKQATTHYLDGQQKLVDILAYSLLPNHFHLLIVQLVDNGLSDFIKRISGGYTSYFNEKYERNGVLFQGRFKRVHVDSDEQYRYLFAYVNENHFVHNNKVKREICHSSSLHHQGILRSKAVSIEEKEYNLDKATSLAKEIYSTRTKANRLSDLFD